MTKNFVVIKGIFKSITKVCLIFFFFVYFYIVYKKPTKLLQEKSEKKEFIDYVCVRRIEVEQHVPYK